MVLDLGVGLLGKGELAVLRERVRNTESLKQIVLSCINGLEHVGDE